MPTVDLSFILGNTMLAGEPFRVHRRRETVDAHGRSIVSTEIVDTFGGVSPQGPNELTRDPERDYSTKSLMINSRFRLRLASPGYKADTIEWPVGSGDEYLVNHIEDYSSYGAGFISARAVYLGPGQPQPPAEIE